MLRVVVVEDEPLALQRLVRFVRADARLQLLAEASDGAAAVALIDEHAPDLVFLDVQLPHISGHEVIERAAHQPMVIFTTAYEEHAVRAFEVGAVDYLVKPFGARRFTAAVDRALRQAERAGEPRRTDSAGMDRLFVARGSDTIPIRIDDVIRLEAAGDYVRVIARAGEFLSSTPLAELHARLPASFVRAHRLHVVNLDFVRVIRQYDGRRVLLKMEDGAEIIASRQGSQELRTLQRLGGR